jgi:hypothetical protein
MMTMVMVMVRYFLCRFLLQRSVVVGAALSAMRSDCFRVRRVVRIEG